MPDCHTFKIPKWLTVKIALCFALSIFPKSYVPKVKAMKRIEVETKNHY